MISPTQSRLNYRFKCDLQKSFITAIENAFVICCADAADFQYSFYIVSILAENSLKLWRI